MVLKKILIPAWPTHYFKAYNIFQLSSFNENCCKFPKSSFLWLRDKIRCQDSTVMLRDYFKYCLLHCIYKLLSLFRCQVSFSSHINVICKIFRLC
jgi:hypothetical protein